MAQHSADIVILGGGIAGLWTLAHLRSLGYNALLLEKTALGGGQSIASQGIIHSGLKYALAGQVSSLAQSISAMPEAWRAALRGEGPVNLSAARTNAESQMLLIPKGFMGGIINVVAKQTLGGRDVELPAELAAAGFDGRAVVMGEPVLDIPSVIEALAAQHADCIRQGESAEGINFKKLIVTAAGNNAALADQNGHSEGLKTQARPLLMGMMAPAPFPLFAHLVGASEKPVATITTHRRDDGTLVWYLGGGVAERDKNSDPSVMIEACRAALEKYMPGLDLGNVQWAAQPIDRHEGKSETDGWLPDTPTVHNVENTLYAWPTKLTFTPMLAAKVEQVLKAEGIVPSGTLGDFSALPPVSIATAPWDTAVWN